MVSVPWYARRCKNAPIGLPSAPMKTLRLDEDLARALAGALLTIARTDGRVNDVETAVLRSILEGIVVLDEEALFFSDVQPHDLRGAVDRALAAGDPYRQSALSSRAEIAGAFLAAARRVAACDGTVSEAESKLIAHFAQALGVGAAVLA